jgi:Tfp pilus assembly protein PilN
MIRINLAPPVGRPRRAGAGIQFRIPEFNFGIAFGVVYAVAFLVLGGWWLQLSRTEGRLTDEVKTKTAELEKLKQRVGQAGKVKEQIADLQKRVDALRELTVTQTRPVKLFDALVDMVPRDLWLTGLEERGPTLKIMGSSFSATAISDFMSNMRSSGRFKDVDIVVSRQDLTKMPAPVTFEVTCRFES